MRKLLRANFARMFRSAAFRAAFAAMAGFGLFSILQKYHSLRNPAAGESLADVLFISFAMIGIAMAAFCSIYLGTEYRDGTMRNKLITGCDRSAVYLSNFIACAAGGLLMQLGNTAVVLGIGVPLCGLPAMSVTQILIFFALGTGLILALAALFTLLSMLIPNPTAAAVISLLAAFAMLVASLVLFSRLQEPEFYNETIVTFDGENQPVEERVPNPLWLNDHDRVIWQTALDVIGQGFELASCTAPDPLRMGLYSLAVIVLCNVAGVIAFRRRDLK